jgi:hypothetical protein
MFEIAFLDAEPELQEDGWLALRGRIVLGDFEEEFLASLDPWSRPQYERHWIEAAQRIVSGRFDRTAFVSSAFQFIWTMWLADDQVLVQEKLLMTDTLIAPFDPSDPYRQVGPHESESDEGTHYSEWKITVEDLRAFIERHADKVAVE